MSDIWTIYWKEFKELLAQGNKQMLIRVVMITALGIVVPLQTGSTWIHLPWFLVLFLSFYPVAIIFTFIADVFAGERERHTLETLLATRLSNWSIVLGKSALLLTLSLSTTLITLLVGLIVDNVYIGGTWTFYPPAALAELLGQGLVDSLLAIFIGIAVSIRSSTVRQAQQTLSYGLVGFGVAVSLLLSQITRLPFFSHLLATWDEAQILLAIIGCIFVIDVVLLIAIMASFKRTGFLLN